MKTICLFLNRGFETMEFSPFVDVCGWARNDYHHDIEVITVGFTKTVVSTFGVSVEVDRLLSECTVADFDALALPGGFEEFGFYQEAFAPALGDLIRAFDRADKPIASVCTGALALAQAGVLTNKPATTYHLQGGHRQAQLQALGATLVNQPLVEADGNKMTSWCPQTAAPVAFWLLTKLIGATDAAIVQEAMGY